MRASADKIDTPVHIRDGRARLLHGLTLGLLALALVCSATASEVTNAPVGPDVNWGPFFSLEYSRECTRVRALGPLYERVSLAHQANWLAVRPLFSGLESAKSRDSAREILWPLAARHVNGTDLRIRCLTGIYHDYDLAATNRHWAFWGLPVFFAGRTAGGEKYFAVFPVGGTVRDILGYDEISFALFPLYAKTRDGSVTGNNLLWPLIESARGKGKRRHRVLPFYAFSEKANEWQKTAVLWPVWTSVRYLREDEPGGGFVLFPLFGRVHVPEQTVWMAIPPLFTYGRSEKMTKINCPWPFVQYTSGPSRKLHIWPIWGETEVGNHRNSFFLWPLFISRSSVEVNRKTETRWVVPFWAYGEEFVRKQEPGVRESGAVSTNVESGAWTCVGSHSAFWPLFNARRTGTTNTLNVLDLWPGPDPAVVERNLAPFWRLWTRTVSESTVSEDLLWGLYRRRCSEWGSQVSLFPLVESTEQSDGRGGRFSLLKGLVGYERQGLRKNLQLLYFLRFEVSAGNEGNDAAAGVVRQ